MLRARQIPAAALKAGKIQRDITEWRAAGSLLQRNVCTNVDAEHFRLLAETLPNLVFAADAAGNCTYVNERWHQYTGATFNEALGLGWLNFIHPEDRGSVEHFWRNVIDCSQDLFEHDFRLRASDGNYHWFMSRANPLKDSSGRIISWVGACTDIDDQKQLAELLERRVMERTAELRQLNSDLQIARDRALEASSLKSKFVANISHEIRTPMSGVLGMAELLLTCALDDEARELAQYIYTSARALLDVVNDLLDFSKLEAGRMSINRMRLSVSSVVHEALKSTTIAAQQKGLVLEVNIAPDLPDVFGDPIRIRQVLLNLVHNAVKFTSHGGVKVDVGLVERKGTMATIMFAVTDTGIGIPRDAQPYLFNPFQQADGSTTRRYGGTGLGLSISKHLVSLMLGEIGFESEEGHGSRFWFKLPLEVA
jgi:hypothetical protein